MEGSLGPCTHGLASPGPALLAYNDGVFSEEDWDGIQNTGDSHKLRDPSTVGRFGLGFNSVYHITGEACCATLPGAVGAGFGVG